jgi:hypothetical protein
VEFGWTNPILIDQTAGILAGRGRLLAARKLGLTEVPVIRFDHLSEAQKRAYGAWDLAALGARAGDPARARQAGLAWRHDVHAGPDRQRGAQGTGTSASSAANEG